MAPKRRPNPIGQHLDILGGKRTVDLKVVQGEVSRDLYARVKKASAAHGYTIREVVEWGCVQFLAEFGPADKAR